MEKRAVTGKNWHCDSSQNKGVQHSTVTAKNMAHDWCPDHSQPKLKGPARFTYLSLTKLKVHIAQ